MNKSNWHMIIGLPKTGSSWLGSILSQNTNFNYFREYFNPWSWQEGVPLNPFKGCKNLKLKNIDKNNQKRELAEAFGFEENIKSIACPWQYNDKITSVFNATWTFSSEEKILDKEVWSFCNVGFFNQYFKIYLLHRSADIIFSQKKQDALLFYKRIYNSFQLNGDKHSTEIRNLIVKKNNVEDQCLIAHELATKILYTASEEYDLPIINYEKLMSEDSYLEDKIDCDLLNNQSIKAINNSKFGQGFVEQRKQQFYMTKTKKIKFL